MHNLTTVIKFEILRTLKKKSFWIMALGFPIMLVALFGIIFFSNKTTDDATKQLEKQSFTIEMTDRSKLINPTIASGLNIKQVTDKNQGIEDVKAGKTDAYFYYPENIDKTPVEVYGKDVSLFDNGRYEGVAKNLLSMSANATVSSEVKSVVQGTTTYNTIVYRNGIPYDAVKQMILPGVFLVLFYLLIAFFGNQMLTSTTEEKENRVIEMILTTIEARTLIIGKIISLVILAVIQAIVIVVPALIGYFGFREKLSLPSIDLTALPVDPTRILLGALFFILSFLLFTGLLVAIGAAVPTAKEAGGFFGIVMMLIFGPLYAASLFVSAPSSSFVVFLTLFPFTAPIPLLLRNALGNLQGWEIGLAIVILSITTFVVMSVAVRIFRFGALEYSRKLSLKEIFARQ